LSVATNEKGIRIVSEFFGMLFSRLSKEIPWIDLAHTWDCIHHTIGIILTMVLLRPINGNLGLRDPLQEDVMKINIQDQKYFENTVLSINLLPSTQHNTANTNTRSDTSNSTTINPAVAAMIDAAKREAERDATLLHIVGTPSDIILENLIKLCYKNSASFEKDEFALASWFDEKGNRMHVVESYVRKAQKLHKSGTKQFNYGLIWKDKLRNHIKLLRKIHGFLKELSCQALRQIESSDGEKYDLSSKEKRIQSMNMFYLPFISDTIALLSLIDSRLYEPLDKMGNIGSYIQQFCKEFDQTKRRKLFRATQKIMLKRERENSTRLDKKLIQLNQDRRKMFEILLVGPEQSGKSTIYKQFVHLHGTGFRDQERLKYRSPVYQNIIGSLQNLIRHASDRIAEQKDLNESCQLIMEQKKLVYMTLKLRKAILRVWNSEVIKSTYEKRSEFKVCQLDDSSHYFLSNLGRIITDTLPNQPSHLSPRQRSAVEDDGYVPTLADVLNCRKRTPHLVQGKFSVRTESGSSKDFLVVDSAGQRGSRRKWIPFFDSCDCVLLVLSLVGYNRYLREQPDVLRMHEAINLFTDIFCQSTLENKPFIIFLNKYDLFAMDLLTTPLSRCFPDYVREPDTEPGSKEDVDKAIAFIKRKILRKSINQLARTRSKPIFHITCATDTRQVDRIFVSVLHIVLRENIQAAGLLY